VKGKDNLQRFWQAPEFWLLLATVFVSMLGVTGWIVVPLTVAGLSISSLPKYIELWSRAEKVGAQAEWWKTVALSAFNSLAAAVAAFVLGNLARWLWW
jgi:ABC-type sulfate transport system permease component